MSDNQFEERDSATTSVEMPPEEFEAHTPHEPHAALRVIPEMNEFEFAEFCENLRRADRLHQPIVLVVGDDGVDLILDGRARERACLLTGVAPRYVRWDGEFSRPENFVLVANVHRRHLTTGQRAAIAALHILPVLRAEAKERQRHHGGTAPGQPAAESSGEEGEAVDLAAAQALVNPSYIRKMERLMQDDPDLAEHVTSGAITIPLAGRLLGVSAATRAKCIEAARRETTAQKKAVAVNAVLDPKPTTPKPKPKAGGKRSFPARLKKQVASMAHNLKAIRPEKRNEQWDEAVALARRLSELMEEA